MCSGVAAAAAKEDIAMPKIQSAFEAGTRVLEEEKVFIAYMF